MEESIDKIVEDKKQRNSAFEILRIIAIIFIIAHHFSVHGMFDFSVLEKTTLTIVNYTWVDFLGQLGEAGVNLFVLISAFFLADSNRFKTKKIIYIIIEMLLFSIVLGTTFFFVYSKEFSIDLIKTIIFPIGSRSWWFMTSYLLLYFFSPFLNLGIRAMGKKMHLIMITVLLVIWSLLPTIIFIDYGFSNFGWFITLYFIAAYIKVYDVSLKKKPYIGILLSVSIFIACYFIKFGIKMAMQGDSALVNRILKWFDLININNFAQVISTILLFVSFKDIKMKSIKIINVIASTTLAIYLFHDQEDVRHFLWVDLFKNASYGPSPMLIPFSIGVILVVFSMGVIIGLAYNYTIGMGINKLLDHFDRKYIYKVDEIFNNGVRRDDN